MPILSEILEERRGNILRVFLLVLVVLVCPKIIGCVLQKMAGAGSGGSGNDVVITEEEYQNYVQEMEIQLRAVTMVINDDTYPDNFIGTRFDDSQKEILKALLLLIDKLLVKFKAPFPQVKVQERERERGQTLVLGNLKQEVPVFDPSIISGENFLKKCQRFFRLKGIAEEHWLDVVALMFKGEQEHWFNYKQDSFADWDDFQTAFMTKYDAEDAQTIRRTTLYTRKQKIHEPFETFVWEMVNLYVQVHQNASEEDQVKHVRDSLFPEIRHELMTIQPLTVEN